MPYSITNVYDSVTLNRPIYQGRTAVAVGDFGVDEGEVFVGATQAVVTSWSASEIEFTTPDIVNGTYDIHADCVNYAAIGIPLIVGTDPPTVGETLTADTTGISDANGIASIALQWYRGASTAIGGATSSTYLVDQADVGDVLWLQATVTDVNGVVEDPLDSADTGIVLDSGGGTVDEYWWEFRTDMGVFPSAGHRASAASAIDWRGYGIVLSSNVPGMVGSRWTGSAWANTEDDGSTVLPEWRRGIQLEPGGTNVMGWDEQSSGTWTSYGIVSIDHNATYAEGDLRAVGVDSTQDSTTGYVGFRTNAISEIPTNVPHMFSALVAPCDHQNVGFGFGAGNSGEALYANVDRRTMTISALGTTGSSFSNEYAFSRAANQSGTHGKVNLYGQSSSWARRSVVRGFGISTTETHPTGAATYVNGDTQFFFAGITIIRDLTFDTSLIQTNGSTVTRADTEMTGDVASMSPITGPLGNDHCGQLIVHVNSPLEHIPVGSTLFELSDTSTSGGTYGLRVYLSADNTFRLDARDGYRETVIADPGDHFTLDVRWALHPDGSAFLWINGTEDQAGGGSAANPASSYGNFTLGDVDSGSPSGSKFPGVYDQFRLLPEAQSDVDIIAWPSSGPLP